MSRHGVKRFVVDVPPEFHKSVKRKALEEDISVSKLIRDFLAEWVKEPPKEPEKP